VVHHDKRDRGLLLIRSGETTCSPIFVAGADRRENLLGLGGPACVFARAAATALGLHTNAEAAPASGRISNAAPERPKADTPPPLLISAPWPVLQPRGIDSVLLAVPPHIYCIARGLPNLPSLALLGRLLGTLNEAHMKLGAGSPSVTVDLGLPFERSVSLADIEGVLALSTKVRLLFDGAPWRGRWPAVSTGCEQGRCPPGAFRSLSDLCESGFVVPCHLEVAPDEVALLPDVIRLMFTLTRGAGIVVDLPQLRLSRAPEGAMRLSSALLQVFADESINPWRIHPISAILRAVTCGVAVSGDLTHLGWRFHLAPGGEVRGLGRPDGPVLGNRGDDLRERHSQLLQALSRLRSAPPHPACRGCKWRPLCDTRGVVDPLWDSRRGPHPLGDLHCAMRLPLFEVVADHLCDELCAETPFDPANPRVRILRREGRSGFDISELPCPLLGGRSNAQ
jgi:hypothetical protein